MLQEISTGGVEGKTAGSPNGEGPGDITKIPLVSTPSVFSSL